MALLLVALAGCSGTTRVVRLENAPGAPLIQVSPASGVEPAELDEDEVQEALTELAREVRPSSRPQAAALRLFAIEARSGAYLFDVRSRRLTPLTPGEHPVLDPQAADVELTRRYLLWCARTGRNGDCLGLLTESPSVTGDARFTLALAMAKGAVLDEMAEAFKDMAEPEAMLAAALWTAGMYAILWTVPEPATKGVAAALTAALIGYVGLDTFYTLIAGFQRLMEAVDRAVTFDELRVAGEQFGKVMGRNAARAFAMLATAVIGSTAATFSARLPTLPGATKAAVNAESQLRVAYAVVGEVQTVGVVADGLAIGLAPGALAMASRGSRGGRSAPAGYREWQTHGGLYKGRGSAGKGKEWHHIVEQTEGNIQQFGPKAVHNTRNVISLDKALHDLISAFYSKKRPRITGSTDLTVREWLSTQSYAAQRDFGVLAIEMIKQGVWR
ncbi:hypothetical protein LXT23_11500 [Pyxidicoccus sp. QH1ED-7-1]|uniref:SitA5 family polymorphic toxin n=1 Tax=Pyxidicoccus xibeiensis TaxID=2906759 RepID=UPI0020A82BDB|nr:hypothetical protein [Pyxidicoccus xibeiensis]MCP3137958.1 hypothetical protein [Pyxidicoccus xibeiensis]